MRWSKASPTEATKSIPWLAWVTSAQTSNIGSTPLYILSALFNICRRSSPFPTPTSFNWQPFTISPPMTLAHIHPIYPPRHVMMGPSNWIICTSNGLINANMSLLITCRLMLRHTGICHYHNMHLLSPTEYTTAICSGAPITPSMYTAHHEVLRNAVNVK